MNIAAALVSLVPGARWSLNGDDISDLIWLDEKIARPSDRSVLDRAAAISVIPADVVSISDRQFAQGLAETGLISEAEAEEWVAAGTLPPALLLLVDQLPVEQRFPARMLLRGATRFEFAHPLAEAFASLASPPWTTEARAAFWRHCATL